MYVSVTVNDDNQRTCYTEVNAVTRDEVVATLMKSGVMTTPTRCAFYEGSRWYPPSAIQAIDFPEGVK